MGSRASGVKAFGSDLRFCLLRLLVGTATGYQACIEAGSFSTKTQSVDRSSWFVHSTCTKPL